MISLLSCIAAPRVAAVQSDRRPGGVAPTPVAIAAIQADRAGSAISAAISGVSGGQRASLDSLKFPLYPPPPHIDTSSPSMVPRPPASYESGFRSMASASGDVDETTSSGSNENCGSEAPLSLVRLPTAPLRTSLPAPTPLAPAPQTAAMSRTNLPPLPPPVTDLDDRLSSQNNSLLNAAMEAVNNYSDASSDVGGDAGDGASDAGSDEVDVAMESFLTSQGSSVVSDSLVKFNLAAPSGGPNGPNGVAPNGQSGNYLNVHLICETASRLLFLSVHWVKAIPAFSLLR